MRALVQRVIEASVVLPEKVAGEIGRGLLVYLGVKDSDDLSDADYLVAKVFGLRIFEDGHGKMNWTLTQVGGSLLVVSQVTLYGDCRKGHRPSFSSAARPEKANYLYQYFIEGCRRKLPRVETGVFREMMRIQSINDGPVTLLLESSKES